MTPIEEDVLETAMAWKKAGANDSNRKVSSMTSSHIRIAAPMAIGTKLSQTMAKPCGSRKRRRATAMP